MLRIIGIILVVLLAAALIIAATKPDEFRVQRSATIHAPPDKIYGYLEDFHRWSAWSPWEKMDPAMTRTFGERSSGVGATYAWSGNRKVGQGRMEIVEAVPASRLKVRLNFLKPFEAHNTAAFTLVPTGDSTTVTWVMEGTNRFVGKLISVFVSMDRMVGKDFETGLANLKAAAEG
jgi:uncharacterized protein YndB with AHSA1/START domain